MNTPFVHRSAALAIVAALALAGCAATGPAREPSGAAAAEIKRIMVVEMPMEGDDKALREQLGEATGDALANAQSAALSDMRAALEHAGIAVDASEAASQAVEHMGLKDASAVTGDMANRLHALSGDDALLRFRITDYGATPKAWRGAYITFEVASTLGLAAIAYSYPATRALAGAYLVQEGIEESAEGYAGFWALDQVCRPVRLQAELVALPSGKDLWKGGATGLSEVRPARLLRKVSDAERAAQTQRATKRAAEKLAAALQDFSQEQQ